jgi:hypothetical protein
MANFTWLAAAPFDLKVCEHFKQVKACSWPLPGGIATKDENTAENSRHGKNDLVLVTTLFQRVHRSPQPLLQWLPGPMNTLAIRHHVLLWDPHLTNTGPLPVIRLAVPPPTYTITRTTALCPAPGPRGMGVSEVRHSLNSPVGGTPWAPKALFGSGRQAPPPPVSRNQQCSTATNTHEMWSHIHHEKPSTLAKKGDVDVLGL